MYLKKYRAFFIGGFMFLALIIPATAEDISGTWIAETPLFTHTMVFKADGTTLTGTVRTREADETEIKDGKIDGNNISFYIERMGRKVMWKGVIDADKIRFTRDESGSVTEMIAKRVRSNPSMYQL
jgi:hypothetical protein